MVPVYCCPGHLSNTILLGALKVHVGLQTFTSEQLKYCDFVEAKCLSWRSNYVAQKKGLSLD